MPGQSNCRRCAFQHRLAGGPKSLAQAGWVKAAERLTTIVLNNQRKREHFSSRFFSRAPNSGTGLEARKEDLFA